MRRCSFFERIFAAWSVEKRNGIYAYCINKNDTHERVVIIKYANPYKSTVLEYQNDKMEICTPQGAAKMKKMDTLG